MVRGRGARRTRGCPTAGLPRAGAARDGSCRQVRITEEPEELRAEITGEDLGILIGRRGQTIDAVEYLAGIAVFPGAQPRKHVELDAEGYKDRRRRQIERVALRKADEAAKRGRPVQLTPMTPAERKIVHLTLRGRTDVVTASQGREPNRLVVISPSRIRAARDPIPAWARRLGDRLPSRADYGTMLAAAIGVRRPRAVWRAAPTPWRFQPLAFPLSRRGRFPRARTPSDPDPTQKKKGGGGKKKKKKKKKNKNGRERAEPAGGTD